MPSVWGQSVSCSSVMPVFLRSGQFILREEAIEKRNIRPSMQNSGHRLIWIPECGPSIFWDQFRPRSHHILPIYPWTTINPILLFSKPLLTAMLHTILGRESLGLEREICTPWEREDLELPLFLYSILFIYLLQYYSDHHNHIFYEYVIH